MYCPLIISQCDYSLYGYRTVSDISVHLDAVSIVCLFSSLCVSVAIQELSSNGFFYPLLSEDMLFDICLVDHSRQHGRQYG